MLVKLPFFLIIILNITGWLLVQLGLAWIFVRLPGSWFQTTSIRRNNNNKLYEKLFFIRRWKPFLPDGGQWVGGDFQKRHLSGKNAEYLIRFVTETRRGEVCHWCALALTPMFAVWNPSGYFVINLGYAIVANLPCILVQRYNRGRLLVLVRRELEKWQG